MKGMYRVVFMVIAVALLVTSASVRASANKTETDVRIESSAKESYVFKQYLKDDAITVQAKDGLVTLTGSVAEESHKTLAQETVASLPGVKSVDNRLELKGEIAAENSDAWVAMNVKASLLFHRHLSLIKTDVLVKDGVVTLSGEAASAAQKDLTTEYIKDVEGVKSVHNVMNVSKAPGSPDEKTMAQKLDVVTQSIDDASITALVKMTLMYHRSTSALNTKVETNNKEVTVSGKAMNASEKDLVTKVVQDVYGVDSVNNKMTIKKPKSPKKVEGC